MGTEHQQIHFERMLVTGGDRSVWLMVAPIIAIFMLLAVLALASYSRAQTARRSLAALSQERSELEQSLTERDDLIKALRQDDNVVRAPAQAAVIIGGSQAINGVLMWHSDEAAAVLHLYGLPEAAPGLAYRAWAIDGEAAKPLGTPIVEEGAALLIAREVPPGAELRITLQAPEVQVPGETIASFMVPDDQAEGIVSISARTGRQVASR